MSKLWNTVVWYGNVALDSMSIPCFFVVFFLISCVVQQCSFHAGLHVTDKPIMNTLTFEVQEINPTRFNLRAVLTDANNQPIGYLQAPSPFGSKQAAEAARQVWEANVQAKR